MELSISEKVTITNPNYLFVFTSHLTFASTSCIASGTSNDRFDEFTIIETNSPNNLLGEVLLSPNGTWDYEVYAQESTTNLLASEADELVEEGLVSVKGTTTEIKQYSTAPDTNNYYE